MNIDEKIDDVLIGNYSSPKEFDDVKELAEFERKLIKQIIFDEIEIKAGLYLDVDHVKKMDYSFKFIRLDDIRELLEDK